MKHWLLIFLEYAAEVNRLIVMGEAATVAAAEADYATCANASGAGVVQKAQYVLEHADVVVMVAAVAPEPAKSTG